MQSNTDNGKDTNRSVREGGYNINDKLRDGNKRRGKSHEQRWSGHLGTRGVGRCPTPRTREEHRDKVEETHLFVVFGLCLLVFVFQAQALWSGCSHRQALGRLWRLITTRLGVFKHKHCV